MKLNLILKSIIPREIDALSPPACGWMKGSVFSSYVAPRRGMMITLGMLLLAWGCEPSDPGLLMPNVKPVVYITVAPLENAVEDHYLAPEIMFRVQWFGSDPDGVVAGYWLQVDSGAEKWTTAGDSVIAFQSSEPDPNNPGKTIPMQHTLRVWSVDNEGLRSDPAVRTFFAANDIPRITSFAVPFPDSATVGPAFSFSLEAADSNASGILYRFWIDGQPTGDWNARSKYQFYNSVEPSLLNTVETGTTVTLDMRLLTNGQHRIWVRAMDLGGAVSDSVLRTITAADTFHPSLTSISASYNGIAFYVDGSVYFAPRAVTKFEMNGSAAAYYGSIQGYRYRLITAANPNPNWSNWGSGSVELSDLPVGEYRFEAQCRDYTNAVSGVSSYALSIVTPVLYNKTILLVDETRDGNGSLGSPTDAQVDKFYRFILGGDSSASDTTGYAEWRSSDNWDITEIDYNKHKVGDTKYISAKDVHNKRIIFWIAEDKTVLDLRDNLSVLTEYLNKGGRLILVGWDVMASFISETSPDSTGFASVFVNKYLRLTAGKRLADRVFVGTEGAGGYPNVNLDRSKILARWAGLDRCWTFTPSHRTQTLGVWTSGTPVAGATAITLNTSIVNIWRTATVGFPLYFMLDSEARAFIAQLIAEMDAS